MGCISPAYHLTGSSQQSLRYRFRSGLRWLLLALVALTSASTSGLSAAAKSSYLLSERGVVEPQEPELRIKNLAVAFNYPNSGNP